MHDVVMEVEIKTSAKVVGVNFPPVFLFNNNKKIIISSTLFPSRNLLSYFRCDKLEKFYPNFRFLCKPNFSAPLGFPLRFIRQNIVVTFGCQDVFG